MSLRVEKHDLLCWTFLSPAQLRLYRSFISSDEVREQLNASKSPLAALTVLKKICDHPRLLTDEMKFMASLPGLSDVLDLRSYDHETLIQESGKLNLLSNLLQRVCLIFCSCIRLSMHPSVSLG